MQRALVSVEGGGRGRVWSDVGGCSFACGVLLPVFGDHCQVSRYKFFRTVVESRSLEVAGEMMSRGLKRAVETCAARHNALPNRETGAVVVSHRDFVRGVRAGEKRSNKGQSGPMAAI